MKSTTVINAESSPREYVKFASVILTIFIASILLNNSSSAPSLQHWMTFFMGLFFLVFASFKLIGYRMFSMMFAEYDIIAKNLRFYGYLYPFIELTLGVIYLFDLVPLLRDSATLVLMAVGSIGVIQELRKRNGIHCACLGNVIKLPLSTVSLIEDIGMGVMALYMLLAR